MDTRELIHAAATIAAGMVTGTKGQLDPGTIIKVAEAADTERRREGRAPAGYLVSRSHGTQRRTVATGCGPKLSS